MWVLLSSRIRTWLLLAVALPVARRFIHAGAGRAARTHPDAAITKVLARLDGALLSWSRRRRRKR